jgi:hypothetical protein
MHYGMVPYRYAPAARDYSGFWESVKGFFTASFGLTATTAGAPKKPDDTSDDPIPSYTVQVSRDYLKEEIKTATGGRILVWRHSTFPVNAASLNFLKREYSEAERKYSISVEDTQKDGWDTARKHYAVGVARLESALGIIGTRAGGPTLAGIKKQLQQGIILPGVQGWSPMIPGAVITVPGPKARKAARDAQAAAAAGAGGGVTTETTILGMSPTTLLLAGGGILAAYLLLSGKGKKKPSSRFTGI